MRVNTRWSVVRAATLATLAVALLVPSAATAAPGWSRPQRVLEGRFHAVSAAVDRAGMLHALVAGVRNSRSGLWLVRETLGGWVAEGVAGGASMDGVLALDAQGNAHVVYHATRIASGIGTVSTGLSYATNRGGEWTRRRVSSGDDWDPAIAVSQRSGVLRVHVVFERRLLDPEDDTRYPRVRYFSIVHGSSTGEGPADEPQGLINTHTSDWDWIGANYAFDPDIAVSPFNPRLLLVSFAQDDVESISLQLATRTGPHAWPAKVVREVPDPAFIEDDALAADFDGNGSVDAADYVVWHAIENHDDETDRRRGVYVSRLIGIDVWEHALMSRVVGDIDAHYDRESNVHVAAVTSEDGLRVIRRSSAGRVVAFLDRHTDIEHAQITVDAERHTSVLYVRLGAPDADDADGLYLTFAE